MVMVVCVYNGAARLPRTLAALAAMDRVGGRLTRVLVVDNNSTDGSADAVRRSASSERRIAFEVVNEPEQGLAAARLRACHATTEDWIAFIDDDCLPEPGWARGVLELADRRPRAGAIGGRVQLELPPGGGAIRPMHRHLLAEQNFGNREVHLAGSEQGLVGAALAIRREAVIVSGWMRTRELSDRVGPSLASGGDFEMVFGIRATGAEVWYTPAAVATHVIPPERLDPLYLRRLARAISRNEARLKWLAHGRPGEAWVRARTARARRNHLRTLWLEWRPWRRAMRLAERAGRREGWEALLDEFKRRS